MARAVSKSEYRMPSRSKPRSSRPLRSSEVQSVLAIDIGSSSVRAALCGRDGSPLPGGAVSMAYQPEVHADGGVWIAADKLLRITERCIDQLFSTSAARGAQIAGVGISSFWHSLIALDVAAKPITPCLLWADTRSEAALPELLRMLREHRLSPGQLHQRTGAPLYSSFFPAKITWLRSVEPRLRGHQVRWIAFSDFLMLRWCGEATTSASVASGSGLWNPRLGVWDPAALDLLHLRPTQLPGLWNSPAALRAPLARRWPRLAKTPWYGSWGDGACANVGSGAVGTHRTALTIGTSSAMRRIIPAAYQVRLPRSLFRYVVDNERHVLGGALSEGGNLYRWARETLALPRPPRSGSSGELESQEGPWLDRLLSRRTPGQHGLTLLPFFAGERSPGWRPQRRALISGLTLATTSIDLLHASLEAVTLQLAWLHDDLDQCLRQKSVVATGASEIRAGGAAIAHSAAWRQMLADALNSPIHLMRVAETSLRGAALLAWEKAGGAAISDVPAATRSITRPRSSAVVRFQELARQQRALYEKAAD